MEYYVVEDAAHAIGGRYLDHPIGSCQFSDIAVFSFHPVKIITTAEGGMATTNNPKIAARLQRIRTNGITRDPSVMKGKSNEPWILRTNGNWIELSNERSSSCTRNIPIHTIRCIR